MADNKPQPERLNKSRNDIREVCFAQIVIADGENLCHRGQDALTPERLDGLMQSLIQEGIGAPFVVYDTGAKVNVAGREAEALGLVGGHRRYFSTSTAIESRLDPETFYPEMKVTVTVMSPGEGQTQEEFRRDILVRSVTENEQRLKHTALERFEITRQFEARGISIPRAASALAISVSQYRRDRLVATTDWLYEAVIREEIGASDAAQLIEVAKEQNCEQQLQVDFEAWVERKKLQLEQEREEQAKLNRVIRGSANTIKKYIDSSVIKGWKAGLLKNQRIDDDAAEFNFGVVVDNDKKMVTVSGLNQSIDKLRSSDLATVIAEMQTGVRKLVPVMRRLQQLEEAAAVSDDEIDAELARIQLAAREAAEAKAAREAGRDPAEAPVGSDAEPRDLTSEIDKNLEDVDQSTVEKVS